MIFTLVIQCVRGRYFRTPFVRTVELPVDMTLGELHYTIQQLTGFDNDHLFTFFIARSDRGKRTCLIETDGWDDGPDEGCELPLQSIFPLPKRMKLYYLFDFGDDWIFQIGKKGQPKPANPRAKYPRVIAKTGRKPVQYPRYE